LRRLSEFEHAEIEGKTLEELIDKLGKLCAQPGLPRARDDQGSHPGR
jgi:hypothetical protein